MHMCNPQYFWTTYKFEHTRNSNRDYFLKGVKDSVIIIVTVLFSTYIPCISIVIVILRTVLTSIMFKIPIANSIYN